MKRYEVSISKDIEAENEQQAEIEFQRRVANTALGYFTVEEIDED